MLLVAAVPSQRLPQGSAAEPISVRPGLCGVGGSPFSKSCVAVHIWARLVAASEAVAVGNVMTSLEALDAAATTVACPLVAPLRVTEDTVPVPCVPASKQFKQL